MVDAVKTRDLYTLALIAFGLLFVAVRIVNAQESADASPSAGGAGLGGPVPANGSPAAPPQSAAGELVANDDATVLVLAMAAVAEATWREADHAAVMHVIRKRAERAGVSLQEMAIEYVAAFDPRTVPTARLRWVLQLNLEATRPEAFPLDQSWSANVDKWLRVIELARAFVADPSSVIDPCPSAIHWAGTTDAIRGRMVRAHCSARTANTFLRLGRKSR